MRKKDTELLAELALRVDAGDEAQAGKMAKHLWRVRRWAAEQTWRADSANDRGRRSILERISASVDGALHELERLKAHRDAPAAAPETSPAPVETAAAAPAIVAPAVEDPKPDTSGPGEDGQHLVPETTE